MRKSLRPNAKSLSCTGCGAYIPASTMKDFDKCPICGAGLPDDEDEKIRAMCLVKTLEQTKHDNEKEQEDESN